MKGKSAIIFLLVVVFLHITGFVPSAQATTVVVNSDDWMDVYSGIEFAHLKGYEAKFMTNKRYATILPMLIPSRDNVIVIESQTVPFTINLARTLEVDGHPSETIYASGGRATNIELAKLANTTSYIVVDPSYGYNAISVIPYAFANKAYVLFADQKNSDQVASFLSTRPVTSLLLYGQLDPGLVDRLAALGPEVINEGNRYLDNLAIVRKQLASGPVSQLILTDGSIIEAGLMQAGKNKEAVLLISKDIVPDTVIDFVKGSNLRSAILVGNHLSQSAKRLKDATGIPVFIKFGQGITRGTIAEPVNALDMLALPVVDLNLVLSRVRYNMLTKDLEVIYENKGIRAFVKTTIGVLVDEKRVATVGDEDMQRIEPAVTAGFRYAADLTGYIANRQNMTVDLFAVYGESPTISDRAIAFTGPLTVITAEDNCKIAAEGIKYNIRTQRFLLKLENEGKVGCYAAAELSDLIVNDQKTTVSSQELTRIDASDDAEVMLKQRMTDVDLADNPDVNVRVRYGEREDFLPNLIEARLRLKVYSGALLSTTSILIGIISILTIVIMLLMVRKRRQRAP